MVREVRSLRVAVIVKDTPNAYARDCRNMGLFSYAVDEFSWDFHPIGKGKTLSTRQYKAHGYDLLLIEDGGSYPDIRGSDIPVVFYAIDSTLSETNHFQPRLEQAKKADLVLIDHDRLERFAACGKPVRRLSYCVNDKLFHPDAKTIDVSFNCGGSPERGRMRTLLHDMTRAHGLSYVSGAIGLEHYAHNLNRAKVVVNVPRNPSNRPHRVFDALASGAALITTPLPDVSGECRKPGLHYLEADADTIPELARILVENMTWQLPATMGYEWVQQHTWRARARELRRMLNEELGI